MKSSILYQKACALALAVIRVAGKMQNRKEFILSRQLVRSGTSVGANLAEAIFAASPKDFLHKNTLALKEAMETSYWLQLVRNSGLINENIDQEIELVAEILRMLVVTIKTLKNKKL